MLKKRVIQVGAGGFGLSWLEILHQHEEIEIVAVVDVDIDNQKRAQELLQNEKVPCFTDYNRAFEEIVAEIAVIVTPPQTHKEIAIRALENDLHVFMEKPIAHTEKDAIELTEFSKSCSKSIMISQNYRYRPEIQAIKNAVNAHMAGPIEYVEWNFRKATKFGGWRDQYDEIIVEDMSIHHFDLMRYLLDENPTSIYAKSMRPSWSWFKGNPNVSATIKLGNILVNYFASWVTSVRETSWNGDFMLYGEKGAITLINDKPCILRNDGTKENLVIPEMDLVDRAYSITEMIRSIDESRLPLTDISDNIHSFQMVSTALKSIKQGKEISL
ncbi:Predicted dehydrogenase [Gracilibacillus ureilyticus]|uniref:Predicted dehydrogenase n=1 Tax=Gracilibacillus ureilyticus TaxID=531814 RepID=A0A1H9Q2I2_9BACI|nr:Gfo/Idh/MocA family oxidoreductase [Gracilibacillus ureilyticus]SER54786.1 Predicted dehydrogenase [Gracilibacillus ureilyticus]